MAEYGLGADNRSADEMGELSRKPMLLLLDAIASGMVRIMFAWYRTTRWK